MEKWGGLKSVHMLAKNMGSVVQFMRGGEEILRAEFGDFPYFLFFWKISKKLT